MVIHSLLQSFAQYCWGGSNLKSVCSFYGFLLIYKFIYCMSSEFWILVQKCSVIQSKSHSIEKIIPVSLCFGCSSFTVCTVYFFFSYCCGIGQRETSKETPGLAVKFMVSFWFSQNHQSIDTIPSGSLT